MSAQLAVVPIRAGALPSGGAEAVAEADGRVLLIGELCPAAAEELGAVGTEVRYIEAGPYAPAEWARLVAPFLTDEMQVILPASPDGRDLAPRLAALLDRPLFAGAMEIAADAVTTIRHGGRVLAEHRVAGPVVVTLQPGVRGVDVVDRPVPTPVDVTDQITNVAPPAPDATVVEVLAPDVSTMDLAEAPRILGGGAGLESAERFAELADIAASLGASMGATRVITDRGWLTHDRQIGTTGVVVDPSLYLAFGISGAVQHTAGLGQPDHIISVNIQQHCPMMDLADLAVVADANATLDELAVLLGGRSDV